MEDIPIKGDHFYCYGGDKFHLKAKKIEQKLVEAGDEGGKNEDADGVKSWVVLQDGGVL